ncbi:MAG: cytochrome c oxidase assembly protein, partial [Gammaproteobacteria bacterium]
HLGGLIIWIPSSMMSALAALIAFSCWIRLDAKGRLSRNRRQRELMRARAAAAETPSAAGLGALAGRTGKST